MIEFDLGLIAGFEWDAGNARKSLDKHFVTVAEAEQVFVDPRLTVADDIKDSQDEARLQALGCTADGRLMHVTFTWRENRTKIRVTSARDANRKERSRYEQET
jgi:hypothetical protein